MIAPDMATMLSFVVTDADIAPAALQALLSAGVGPTFNSVTVDSDTSTSDTLMLFATGAAAVDGQPAIADAADPRLDAFRLALNDLLRDLALQVVRDGEGARKMVEVTVEGAENDAAAKRIALSIANSPLVKTAVAGEDANWGAWSWLSASPVRWPNAIGWRFGSAMCAWPSKASVIPPIRKRQPLPS